jgi:phosphate acetyltransferase
LYWLDLGGEVNRTEVEQPMNPQPTHEKYRRLLESARALKPVPTAVAHPWDESSLSGAVDAAKLGLIKPILVGPKAKIEAVAKQELKSA